MVYKARTALLLVSMATVLSTTMGAGRMVGGRTDVEDVASNKEIQNLGRFSVCEYNRRQASSGRQDGGEVLAFSRVVKAQTQVVSGIKYYLRIEVKVDAAGTRTRLFDSVVVVKPWRHHRQLIDFAPVTAFCIELQ